jgi:hypothetical protein
MGPTDARSGDLQPAFSLGRGLRVLLVGLVLARGLAELCVLPPFEGWDEYQHVAYVVHVLETGEPAVLGKTEVPRSLLAAMLPDFPQPRTALPQLDPRWGALDYQTYWTRRTATPTPRHASIPVSTDGTERANAPKLYESQHSWWYYRLVAPLFAKLGGVHDLRRSVGGLRLLNLLITAASVWIALGVVARRVRSRPVAAWIGLAIAAHPFFLINGARVSSDALGILLATVVVALALGLDGRRLIGRCGMMGLLTGLAILTKATNWTLVPLLAGSWLLAVIRDRPLRRTALAAGLALTSGIVLLVGPEVRSNLATYGIPTAMQEAVLNHQRGRGPVDLMQAAAAFRWFAVARWLWLVGSFLRGGWSLLEPSAAVSRVYYWAVVAAILGWGWWLLDPGRRPLGAPRPESRRGRDRIPTAAAFDSLATPGFCALFCASVTAAVCYHAIQSKLAWGESTTGAWYAAAAFPWFQVVAIAGALAWPGRLGPALAAALIGSYLVGEQAMIWMQMLPTYSGGATGLEALGRLAQLQPTWLGTAAFLAALSSAGLILVAIGMSIARSSALGSRAETISSTRGPHSVSGHRREEASVRDQEGSGPA